MCPEFKSSSSLAVGHALGRPARGSQTAISDPRTFGASQTHGGVLELGLAPMTARAAGAGGPFVGDLPTLRLGPPGVRAK
jgi:hypothetical protein